MRLVATLTLGGVVVGVVVLLAVSPRHRAFYLGHLGGGADPKVTALASDATPRQPPRATST